MNLVFFFKEKFNNYEDLSRKRKELKEKLPHLIHSVSIRSNVITTMKVDSYVRHCIDRQIGLSKKEIGNKYAR